MISLLLTIVPIVAVLLVLIVWKRAADIAGLVGLAVTALIAWLAFATAPEVIGRSILAGGIRSFPVSLIVAASLLQMAFLEKTGALKRIIIFLKTVARGNPAAQIMMVNIGFGTLMVAVGATPVSILPPILIAMVYSSYAAIALPAIGYDSLCTYALLGAPIVVFQGFANGFLLQNHYITQALSLSDIGMIFWFFLPLVSTLIGFCMLWIVGRGKAIKQGWLPCLIAGAVIGIVSWFTNRFDNFVILTGILCGIAVILAMVLYLKAGKQKVIDPSILTADEIAFAQTFPLWKALAPWGILVALILILNLPKPLFNYLYGVLKLPVLGLSADGKAIDTRALWQAYTWILASIALSLPLLKPTAQQMRETLRIWLKRAPRPVFAAAIFFAVGEIMNLSGFDMSSGKFATASMVKVLADNSAAFFGSAYGAVVGFIGLFGGFITGSESSTVAMIASYTLNTSHILKFDLTSLLIVTAGLAFGGGLASVVSPAKLQNAAAAIDRTGEEHVVIRSAFVFSLILTSVTACFILMLLGFHNAGWF